MYMLYMHTHIHIHIHITWQVLDLMCDKNDGLALKCAPDAALKQMLAHLH